MSSVSKLANVFEQYDTLLYRYRDFWQVEAIAQTEWPWQHKAAELNTLLTPALSELQNPVAPATAKLTKKTPFWLTNGIQGRKLAQINGFLAEFSNHTTPPDVMHQSGNGLPSNATIVALHACGDLHRQLLEQANSIGKPELFVAPCCYHLQQAAHYHPLSKRAQQSSLRLSRTQLKLAVQEQVTGGKRVSKLRDIEQLWRLVFAIYRTQITGCDTYHSLPSVPKHW